MRQITRRRWRAGPDRLFAVEGHRGRPPNHSMVVRVGGCMRAFRFPCPVAHLLGGCWPRCRLLTLRLRGWWTFLLSFRAPPGTFFFSCRPPAPSPAARTTFPQPSQEPRVLDVALFVCLSVVTAACLPASPGAAACWRFLCACGRFWLRRGGSPSVPCCCEFDFVSFASLSFCEPPPCPPWSGLVSPCTL